MGLKLPILIAVSVAAFIMIPIGMLIVGSFSSSGLGEPLVPSTINYEKAFSDKLFLPSLVNTLIFAAGSTILAISVAVGMAWIVVRTDTPMKRFAEFLPIFPLLLPPMMDNIAWIFLISPRAGIINRYLQDTFGIQPLFNAFSLPAMIWVFGLSQVPLAYLIIASAFTNLDPSLEESATVSGSGVVRTFFRITVPLMVPAILSAGVLTFVATMRSFETPTLQGIPGGVFVYVSRIYSAMSLSTPPDTGLATAYSVVLLAITLSAVGLYLWSLKRVSKFQVITGRGYRPRIITIGRWRYATLGFVFFYFVVAVLLPFFVVTVMSVMPYFSYSLLSENLFESLTLRNYIRILDHPLITEGMFNSAWFGLSSAFLCVFIGFVTSYIVYRTKVRGRKFLEAIGTIPIAFPGLVIGLALLWTFFYLPGRIYGGPIAVILALIVFKLPIALRSLSGSIVQIHHELEEAARVAGGSWAYTFRRITFSLMKPALAAVSLFLFLAAFKEVGAVILLSGPGTIVAAVALFNYYGTGQWMALAAGAVVYSIVLFAVVVAARYIFKIKLRL